MNASTNATFEVAHRSLADGRQQFDWTVLFKASTRWLQRRLSPQATVADAAPHPEARRQDVARGQSVSLTQPRGHCIACEAGALWLTFDGERRDIVLEAGQRHVCDTDARLIVHALAAGAFRVD